jgi:hypothetical protein
MYAPAGNVITIQNVLDMTHRFSPSGLKGLDAEAIKRTIPTVLGEYYDPTCTDKTIEDGRPKNIASEF